MLNVKKAIALLLILVLSILCISCEKAEGSQKDIQLNDSQMRAISELAAMECYYHNVAKFEEEDAAGILLWKKDKHFWIEYSGIVKIGIDASLLELAVEGDTVHISIPNAKVLSTKVDQASLTKDSFIVDVDSASISAEDETEAFKEAQKEMTEAASNDLVLLENAQQRVRKLLEEYVMNIGEAAGKEYSIEWTYIE